MENDTLKASSLVKEAVMSTRQQKRLFFSFFSFFCGVGRIEIGWLDWLVGLKLVGWIEMAWLFACCGHPCHFLAGSSTHEVQASALSFAQTKALRFGDSKRVGLLAYGGGSLQTEKRAFGRLQELVF